MQKFYISLHARHYHNDSSSRCIERICGPFNSLSQAFDALKSAAGPGAQLFRPLTNESLAVYPEEKIRQMTERYGDKLYQRSFDKLEALRTTLPEIVAEWKKVWERNRV